MRHLLQLKRKLNLQKQKRSNQKIAARRVAKVEDAQEIISSGKIVLLDPGEGAIWVLVDSGSSINAAAHSRHFPGAKLEPPNADAMCQSATGHKFSNDGQFHIPCRTDAGHRRSTDLLNTKVSVPVMSVNELNAPRNKAAFEDQYGRFVQTETGQ